MRVIGLFPPNCKIRCYEVPFYVVSRSLIKTLSQLPSSCNSSCHGKSDGVRVNAVVKWSWMNNLIKINSGADYQTQMGVKGRLGRSVNVPRMEATIYLIKRGYDRSLEIRTAAASIYGRGKTILLGLTDEASSIKSSLTAAML